MFIARSESDRLPQVLEYVADKAILTVGDASGYGKAGVMINFYVDGDRLHFEINLDAAKEADIQINPFLLDYAKILDSSEEPNDES